MVNLKTNEKGQAIIEYAMLTILIGMMVVTTLRFVGTSLRGAHVGSEEFLEEADMELSAAASSMAAKLADDYDENDIF